MAVAAPTSASMETTAPDAERAGFERHGRSPKLACISAITSFMARRREPFFPHDAFHGERVADRPRSR